MTRPLFAVLLVLSAARPALAVPQPPAAGPPTTAPEAAEPAKEEEPTPKWTYGGQADFYFVHNFNEPFNHKNQLRFADVKSDNGPHLGLIDAWIERSRDPVGFRLELTWGPTARISITDDAEPSPFWEHVQQVYVSANLDRKGRTYADFGKWYSPAGLESIVPRDNPLYSMGFVSNLATPYYLLGLRVTHALNETDTLMAHVNRGWSTVSSPGHGPGFGISYNRTFSPRWAGTVNYLGGDQVDYTGRIGWANLTDLIGQYTPPGRAAYSFEVITANQENVGVRPGVVREARWYGSAAVAKYRLDAANKLAFRADWLQDVSGFLTGASGNVYSLTLGYTHAFNPHFETRVEYRHDFAAGERPFFGSRPGDLRAQQPTFTIAAIVGF